jgi:hypothetical protein
MNAILSGSGSGSYLYLNGQVKNFSRFVALTDIIILNYKLKELLAGKKHKTPSNSSP